MIKSAVLAAVAALGIGSAAGAATVKNYDLHLRYEGTAFYNLVLYDPLGDKSDLVFSSYPSSDPLKFNLKPPVFPNLTAGQIIRFVAQVIFPDDESAVVTQYGNGGKSTTCVFGNISCTNTEAAYQLEGNKFRISYSDSWFIFGDTEIGSTFEYLSLFTSDTQSTKGGEWNYNSMDQASYFTVVGQPAPVPLPASAALLPLGLGALAMMRKRRRKTS